MGILLGCCHKGCSITISTYKEEDEDGDEDKQCHHITISKVCKYEDVSLLR